MRWFFRFRRNYGGQVRAFIYKAPPPEVQPGAFWPGTDPAIGSYSREELVALVQAGKEALGAWPVHDEYRPIV